MQTEPTRLTYDHTDGRWHLVVNGEVIRDIEVEAWDENHKGSVTARITLDPWRDGRFSRWLSRQGDPR